MKISRIIIVFALLLGLCACNKFDSTETDYEVAIVYLGSTEGGNFFSQGDVNICVDNSFQVFNTGSDKVEFAFVKDLVYRLRMVDRIPTDGWSETIDHINLQDGYVGRLLLDDGSYEYCRFCVYTIDYNINAEQFILFKYQSNFTTK